MAEKGAPARLAGVGVFVIGGLLLFTIGLFMIGDRQMAFARKFSIYTEFTRIPGLQPGTIVRVSGAKAGTVKEIVPPSKPSDKFHVKVEIAEQLHPLVRTDSVATIETEGLVGGTFLSIGTGTDRAEKIAENSTIPGHEPLGIADLIQQMSETVRKVNATIDDLKGDLQMAIAAVGDTVKNVNGVIDSVKDDVMTMASAGARITGDVAEITDSIRNGKGTVGKLVNDDELYQRAVGIAKNAEAIAGDAKQVVEQAREAIANFRSKDGPVQGVVANLRQTMDDARVAMAGFAENMEALKRNFFFRGYFNKRGYYSLADISPAEYRQGLLTRGNDRRLLRIWLRSDLVFDPDGERRGDPALTEGGKARLDSAVSSYLDRINRAIVIIEGYAQHGSGDEQYLRSRARAAVARDYLIGRFHLDPQNTGLMALGNEAAGSPNNGVWDGVAVAVFLDKEFVAQTR